jgi:hypothetical protein
MAYIVVAFYTENTGYQEEIKNLEASLKKHNIPMDLVAIPSQASWQANTHYKPYFIKQMMYRHFPKDILYLDADAVVQQYPVLFDHFKGDVGVFFLERENQDEELVSSTLYFANNQRSLELVERWIACCIEYHTVWDQKVLQHIVYESGDLNINIVRLPPTYCQIFDLMKDAGQPVIEQFQASRRLRDEADNRQT